MKKRKRKPRPELQRLPTSRAPWAQIGDGVLAILWPPAQLRKPAGDWDEYDRLAVVSWQQHVRRHVELTGQRPDRPQKLITVKVDCAYCDGTGKRRKRVPNIAHPEVQSYYLRTQQDVREGLAPVRPSLTNVRWDEWVQSVGADVTQPARVVSIWSMSDDAVRWATHHLRQNVYQRLGRRTPGHRDMFRNFRQWVALVLTQWDRADNDSGNQHHERIVEEVIDLVIVNEQEIVGHATRAGLYKDEKRYLAELRDMRDQYDIIRMRKHLSNGANRAPKELF